MSSYNSYQTGWNTHRHQQAYGGNHPHAAHQEYHARRSNARGQSQDGMLDKGSFQGYPFPDQEVSDKGYSPYMPNHHQGRPSDMQHMIQMMNNLGNQLERLNQLILQNNQLLQTMHDKEDTKCIQGTGGGAIIVRM